MAQLLDDPGRCGILGDMEVKEFPSSMVDHEPDVDQLEADRRDHEEVHPDNQILVVPQERHPALVLTCSGLGFRQIARDRGETHPDFELRKLGLYLPCAQRFSVAIRTMRCFVSSEIGGRPGPGIEIPRQERRKPF